jgi:hypothetical protein
MNMNLHNFKFIYTRLIGLLACGLLVIAGAARSLPAQTASDSTAAQNKPSEKKDAQASAPASSSEGLKLGVYEGHSEIEIGYRWVSDTAGNKDMYRSMINLGEGPKVLRSRISMRSNYGSGILFDHLDLSLDNWGGDPYNTMRLNFGRTGAYEFRADYRNLNYFNFVPAFANPLLAKGQVLDQHGQDVTFRGTDIELKLFTTRKLRPYVGYSRSSGTGPAFATYSLTGNEFLLNSQWHYSADDYRGGVDIVLPKLALTLEQGYRFMKGDTGLKQDGAPQGNNTVPFLGQNIVLDSLQRGYHDRTTLPVSKVVLKFTPFEQLKITGRYVYAMSDLESSMGEVDTGNLVSLENRLLYAASSDAFNTRAKQPNHNGSFLVEFAPFSHVTFLHQLDTRNFHVSGDAVLASLFLKARSLAGSSGETGDVRVTNLLGSLLAYDQLRNQTEVEVDVSRGFMVRAGHRYLSAETSLQSAENGDTESRTASYTQHTGILGVAFARGQWLRLALDYEKNMTDGAFMRTDLLDNDEFKLDWRLGGWKKFTLNGRVAFLRNTNGQSDIDFKSHNRNYTVAINYEPSDRFSLNLDYSRTSILSDIAILLPQTLQLDRSLFDERGNGVGGSMAIGIYRGSKVELGYHGILNVGSYPLNYHQPYASATIPLVGRVAFKSYWQYFGYNERGSNLQDHRTHMVTFSLAYMR